MPSHHLAQRGQGPVRHHRCPVGQLVHQQNDVTAADIHQREIAPLGADVDLKDARRLPPRIGSLA